MRTDKGLHITIWIGRNGIMRSDVVLASRNALTWTTRNEGAVATLEREVNRWMARYVKGEELPLPPIDLAEQTPFTQRVLAILQTIPFGQTLTYGEVAKRLGNPRGSRAVGAACGRNPALLFVPCHRVLAAGGELGGFTAGLEIKRRLLMHESHANG